MICCFNVLLYVGEEYKTRFRENVNVSRDMIIMAMVVVGVHLLLFHDQSSKFNILISNQLFLPPTLQIFGDYYYFQHQRVHKRSANPSAHHQDRLDKDVRVQEAIQQVAKSRQKRDFLRPRRTFELNDPRWQQMWYLVSVVSEAN